MIYDDVSVMTPFKSLRWGLNLPVGGLTVPVYHRYNPGEKMNKKGSRFKQSKEESKAANQNNVSKET